MRLFVWGRWCKNTKALLKCLGSLSGTAGSLHRHPPPPPTPPLKADKDFTRGTDPVFEAKHSCDRTQREERGAAGRIHPRQPGPIYLSPCANKVSCWRKVLGGCEGVRGVGVHKGCWRCCSLTPITLPLISPPLLPLALSSLLHTRSLRSSRDGAREGSRAAEGSHVFISHFLLHFSLLFTAVIFAPHIKCAARNTQEGADLRFTGPVLRLWVLT